MAKEYEGVKKYIDKYHSALPSNIFSDPKFSFRVFLIPKVGNREKTSDVAIEFIKYDPSKPKEMKLYKKFLIAIKEKRSNGEFRPSKVAKKVYEALKNKMPKDWKFTASYHHSKCWKYYKIRPKNGAKDPFRTNEKYCYYDEAFGQYVYTQEWIDFLIDKLANKEEYKKIFGKNL
ncbi:hypothetical protein HNP65_001252 [Thermosipho japonicus]|uniref:Uncharacterized protein n=1 Tax=Thermosipho japonicus TaxID=90323 RepID=A0A841GTS2_9BACT|nr:hypothetical protein [Thermosipho japonicus]MBB6062800.1 hypothetical protein [Thermosipho japonicus]